MLFDSVQTHTKLLPNKYILGGRWLGGRNLGTSGHTRACAQVKFDGVPVKIANMES